MTPEMSVGFDWLQENWPASWQEPVPCVYRYPFLAGDDALNAADTPVPTCFTEGENMRAEWREDCWYVWSFRPGGSPGVLFVAMSPRFL